MTKYFLSVGKVVGRLTLLSKQHRYKQIYWEVRCKCGIVKEVQQSHLLSGSTKSCGCYRNDVAGDQSRLHGKEGTPVYRAYYSMFTRCSGKSKNYYKNYFVKGITVCDEWDTFEKFYADMGDIPNKGMSLDRIDNTKGYSKENCRWATPSQQAQNKSNTVLNTEMVKVIKYLYKEKGVTAKRIANAINRKYSTVYAIINNKSWRGVSYG